MPLSDFYGLGAGGGVSDGDKGDIVVSSSGAVWSIDTSVATTVGRAIMGLANPGAITFVRINADNTVTARSASDFRGDLAVPGTAVANTFTAQNIFETGAAGASPVIFRQTGGVAGTDELQIGDNGTRSLIESKQTALHILVAGAVNSNGVNINAGIGGGVCRLVSTGSNRLHFEGVLSASGSASGWETNSSGYFVPTNTGFRMATGNTSPQCMFHATQQTLGNEVIRIDSVATNDDPMERMFQNRAATTDATVTTLHTFATASNTSYLITAHVIARRTGGASGAASDSASYMMAWGVKNAAGTVTAIGGAAVTNLHTAEDQAGWDATLDIDTTNVRVRVTGAASNNITWHLAKFTVSPLSS
jgi:hypothetical protein